MIRCAVPRGSHTAQWLTIVNRSYASKAISTEPEDESSYSDSAARAVASADDKGVGKAQNNGLGRSQDLQDGTDAPSKSYIPRELPLSPFMVPEAIEAREKHKKPKLLPSKTPTLFQQQLNKNPYAQALATPIRACQVTDTRLPTYFLQDFEIMAHPETRQPWWVPTSLRKNLEDRDVTAGKDKGASIMTEEESEPKGKDLERGMDTAEHPTIEPETTPSSEALPSRTLSLGPGVYTLSRQALLIAMKRPKSGWNMPPWKLFTTGSKLNSAVARKVINHTSWRTDMEDFVLELMRRRVVEGLVYLVQRKRGYVAGCVDWEDAKMTGRQQAVILWTGCRTAGVERQVLSGTDAADESAQMVFSEDGSTEHYPDKDDPPGFATLTIGKDKPHMVPVHNLLMLLGPKHLEDLRRKCPIFEKEVLLVRNKKITVDVQLKLWKLQGYVAFPEVKVAKPQRVGRRLVQREGEIEADASHYQESTMSLKSEQNKQ